MPCKRECEYDDEILLLYFSAVWLIALIPRLLRTSRTVRYTEYVAKLRAAPGIFLFCLLEVLMYSLAALAAVVVRIDGGHYERDVNRIALGEFWILQFVLALYFHLFYNCAYLILGLLPLLAAILISFVVAVFFFAVSDVAGAMMYLFSASLIALFVLSVAIALYNSERTVVRATIQMTNNNDRQRYGRSERV
jgi:uncharacterized membrane protein YoaT (DUF817 family)